MTRKFDDMRMKYDSLQELAQNAAETNFDKLKKASDEKTKGKMALILISNIKLTHSQMQTTSFLPSNAKSPNSATPRPTPRLNPLVSNHKSPLCRLRKKRPPTRPNPHLLLFSRPRTKSNPLSQNSTLHEKPTRRRQ